MSDRFYNQMLEATGWCPGFKNTHTLEEYERKYGKTKDWKKAYVRLKDGFDISYGETEAQ